MQWSTSVGADAVISLQLCELKGSLKTLLATSFRVSLQLLCVSWRTGQRTGSQQHTPQSAVHPQTQTCCTFVPLGQLRCVHVEYRLHTGNSADVGRCLDDSVTAVWDDSSVMSRAWRRQAGEKEVYRCVCVCVCVYMVTVGACVQKSVCVCIVHFNVYYLLARGNLFCGSVHFWRI